MVMCEQQGARAARGESAGNLQEPVMFSERGLFNLIFVVINNSYNVNPNE